MEDYKICGIVAAAGLLTAEEEKIFKFLLILDTVRGEDSTGIAGVSVNGDVCQVKDALIKCNIATKDGYGYFRVQKPIKKEERLKTAEVLAKLVTKELNNA